MVNVSECVCVCVCTCVYAAICNVTSDFRDEFIVCLSECECVYVCTRVYECVHYVFWVCVIMPIS